MARDVTAKEEKPPEWQGCPKCGKLTLGRTGVTNENGQLVKHMLCQTCGYQARVPLS